MSTESDPEGRYAGMDVAGIAFVVCMQCGCLVGNRDWHDEWHYTNEVGADEP